MELMALAKQLCAVTAPVTALLPRRREIYKFRKVATEKGTTFGAYI
jgi:hypothetical protein